MILLRYLKAEFEKTALRVKYFNHQSTTITGVG